MGTGWAGHLKYLCLFLASPDLYTLTFTDLDLDLYTLTFTDPLPVPHVCHQYRLGDSGLVRGEGGRRCGGCNEEDTGGGLMMSGARACPACVHGQCYCLGEA